MPSINILYLIEKDVLYISTIYLIDTRKQRIQVFCLQFCETVVIKVGVAIVDAMLQKHLMAKGRFATSPYPYHDLCKGTVKLEQRLLAPLYPLFGMIVADVFFLLCQYLKHDSFFHHNRKLIDLFKCKNTENIEDEQFSHFKIR